MILSKATTTSTASHLEDAEVHNTSIDKRVCSLGAMDVSQQAKSSAEPVNYVHQ